MKYRIKPGDTFQLVYFASVAPTVVRAWIDIETDSKKRIRSEVFLTTFTADRTGQSVLAGQQIQDEGTVVGGGALMAGTIQRGQFYVNGRIRPTNSPGPDTPIFAGYMYSGKEQVGIGEFVEPGPAGGHGAILTITGTDPGSSGEEISEVVPTNAERRLISWQATLATSGDAGTRTPHLVIDNGAATGKVFVRQLEDMGINSTFRHVVTRSPASDLSAAGIALTDSAVDNRVFPGLPLDLPLIEDYRVRTLTTNIDTTGPAFDDWGAPVQVVEEWIRP